jgi:arginine-tRNA-protein transferase
LSAIYFFYDPDERDRSLGTWNVLCLLDAAVRRGLPYVYLGYFVEGCASMEYKVRFVPNELRGDDGAWRLFRT